MDEVTVDIEQAGAKDTTATKTVNIDTRVPPVSSAIVSSALAAVSRRPKISSTTKIPTNQRTTDRADLDRINRVVTTTTSHHMANVAAIDTN